MYDWDTNLVSTIEHLRHHYKYMHADEEYVYYKKVIAQWLSWIMELMGYIVLDGWYSIFFSLEFNKIPTTLRNFERIEMFVKLKNCYYPFTEAQAAVWTICVHQNTRIGNLNSFFRENWGIREKNRHSILMRISHTDKRYNGHKKRI